MMFMLDRQKAHALSLCIDSSGSDRSRFHKRVSKSNSDNIKEGIRLDYQYVVRHEAYVSSIHYDQDLRSSESDTSSFSGDEP